MLMSHGGAERRQLPDVGVHPGRILRHEKTPCPDVWEDVVDAGYLVAVPLYRDNRDIRLPAQCLDKPRAGYLVLDKESGEAHGIGDAVRAVALVEGLRRADEVRGLQPVPQQIKDVDVPPVRPGKDEDREVVVLARLLGRVREYPHARDACGP